ncbi:MAG: DUF3095 domain-containing protein [Paracoccaceae bacterium]
MHSESYGFYEDLRPTRQFSDLTEPALYADVPDDWLVGVADVVNSTAEIVAGRYKTVNMVGAAVISAATNGVAHRPFPYVFGGDGAGFAIWPETREVIESALSAVQAWAKREFGIQLRAALVPVSDLRAAGQQLRVARFQASQGVDYAMFAGGGLTWAEGQMKAGTYAVAAAPEDAIPDLTGLSCRWSNQPARNGTILSVVILPGPNADDARFGRVARDILRIGEGLELGGHPLPARGPDMQYPPPGLDLDARVSRGSRSLGLRKAQILVENLFFWFIFTVRLRMGNFRPEEYRADVAANADFRKFDDGLKMTLDSDPDTRNRIEAVLSEAEAKGLVRYGLAEQDEAMVTCFVPSATQKDHVHFVDGAGGGYTQAASQIKAT